MITHLELTGTLGLPSRFVGVRRIKASFEEVDFFLQLKSHRSEVLEDPDFAHVVSRARGHSVISLHIRDERSLSSKRDLALM